MLGAIVRERVLLLQRFISYIGQWGRKKKKMLKHMYIYTLLNRRTENIGKNVVHIVQVRASPWGGGDEM